MPFKIANVFQSSKEMMLATGIWPQENPNFIDNFKAFLSHTNFFIMLILLMIEVHNSFHSFVKLSEILFVLCTFLAYYVKVFSLRYKKNEFLKLVEMLEDLENHPADLEHYIKNAEVFQTILAKSYRWTCGITLSCFALFPYFDENKPLPLPFPYCHTGFMRYFLYVFMISGLGICAWNNSCLDLLPTSFMAIAAAELDILNDRLALSEKIFIQNNVELSKEKEVGYFLACAKQYDLIIRFVKQIEKVFTVGFLAQFMGSTFVICNTGFQLMVIPWVSMQFLTLFFYFVAMIAELTMICWFGNEIILKSLEISSSCYFSNWYNYDSKTKKILFIIMERSKRPLIISTYKFSSLSLTAFTSIIHWSYSYFTLLRRLYKK